MIWLTLTTVKSHQIANIQDDSYRTESDTVASDVIKRNHAYRYDANGNLVYVNTGREKQDGQAESGANEKKHSGDIPTVGGKLGSGFQVAVSMERGQPIRTCLCRGQ